MLDVDTLLQSEDLYHTEFYEGWKFTWRLLTQKEYRVFAALRAQGALDELVLYKKVFERVYLGDPGLINQRMPLGVPLSIGKTVMWLSGDCTAETLREEIDIVRSQYREDDVYETIKRIIGLAYPAYKPEDLEDMNRIQLLRLLVKAEAIHKLRIGDKYKPLTIEDVKPEVPKTAKGPNFQEENAAISEHVHPWDTQDLMEEEYQREKAATKLSTAAAKKLDRRPKERG